MIRPFSEEPSMCYYLSQKPVGRCILCLAFFCIALGISDKDTFAQSGQVVSLPTNTQRRVNPNIDLQADLTGLEGIGYRPLRFTIRFGKPPQTDVSVRIAARSGEYSYRRRTPTSAEDEYVIPAGSTSYDCILLMPVHARMQFVEWGRLHQRSLQFGPLYEQPQRRHGVSQHADEHQRATP